jgi:transcriptional regulator with XRE-family HTH domain
MPNRKRVEATIPEDARVSLERMGSAIRSVRKLRGLTITDLAERSMVSRPTIIRIEHGDPMTSMGAVATVLSMLGLIAGMDIGSGIPAQVAAGGDDGLDDF